MKKIKELKNCIIRTEKQLKELLTKYRYWDSDQDIRYIVYVKLFKFSYWTIDRRLMLKLLHNGRIKYLTQEHSSLNEFLAELALGTLDENSRYIFYHVCRGYIRGNTRFRLENTEWKDQLSQLSKK